MNIKFLLLGTSLSFIPLAVNAQCVVTQDCETLGYTETSCNGGKGVKCPFGNKWCCFETEESVCIDNGFKYSCSGTGYSGGSGDSCGGKYKKCSCTSGYKWSGSACKKESCSSSYKYTCKGIGYSGGSGSSCGGKYTSCTCASGYEWKDGSCVKKEEGELYFCKGKVVGVRISGMSFYIAMNDFDQMDWGRASGACSGYSFCDGAKGSLPTQAQLLTIYKYKESLNKLLSTYGGGKILDTAYWGQEYKDYIDNHCIVDMSNGLVSYTYRNVFFSRPILKD